MHLVLLPGMDGTGDLFQWLVEALPDEFGVSIVRYPMDESLDWSALLEVAQRSIPAEEPYVIVAESFSGPIAIELAAKQPNNLCALVLCCTYPSNPLPWFMRWLQGVARPRFFQRALPDSMIRRNFVGPKASDDLIRTIQHAVGSVSPDVLAQRVRFALTINVVEKLREIVAPTLVLTAKKDRIIAKDCIAKLLDGLHEATHVALDGPHLLLQVKPEESASAILDFLVEEDEQPLQTERGTSFQDKIASTGIGCAFFFVLSLALFGWWYSESPFDNQKFSAAEWAAGWEEDRGHMTMDLIENHLPIGITESEVIALLGNPDSVSKAFVYGIGSWGFGVNGDDSYLSIYFDESGKLLSAEIWGV